MKNTIVVLAGGGLAVMVAAQDQLSECGRKCLTNMVGLAPELKCAGGLEGEALTRCLCGKGDYARGISDCSVEACSPEESRQLVQYARTQCQDLGITGASSGGGTTDVPADISGSVNGGGGNLPTVTGGSAVAEDTSVLDSATARGVITTITTEGQVITTTLSTENSDSTSATEGSAGTGDETTSPTTGASTQTGAQASPSASGEGNHSATIRAITPLVGAVVAAVMAVSLL